MAKQWTASQIKILEENYFSKGSEYVSRETGKSAIAIRCKARLMGIKGNHQQCMKVLRIPENDKKMIRTLVIKEKVPMCVTAKKFELTINVVRQVMRERVSPEAMFI